MCQNPVKLEHVARRGSAFPEVPIFGRPFQSDSDPVKNRPLFNQPILWMHQQRPHATDAIWKQ